MIHFGIPIIFRKYMITRKGFAQSTVENGMAYIKSFGLTIIWSNGMGWEHVSVSRKSRMPSYEDMDWVKKTWWWDPDATVMQLHVSASRHINCHPYCLHLWRPIDQVIPTPSSILVGPSE